MKNIQEKLLHFELACLPGITITHGYNICNAFPVHFHATYNLGIIELGEREFTYRGENTVLKPNDVFMIQPFEPHSCQSIGNRYHSYKMISFQINIACYFKDLRIDTPELLNKIRRFHTLAEYEKESPQLPVIFTGIKDLLMKCSVEYAVNDETIVPQLSASRQFIENNCQRELSLKEIADVASLSEFHFSRHFHKAFGLSPYAYYLVCKLKLSQATLRKQRCITDTTYDIGFFDQSHFTRLFKKHIGVSPGKYLKDNL